MRECVCNGRRGRGRRRLTLCVGWGRFSDVLLDQYFKQVQRLVSHLSELLRIESWC